MSDASEDDMQRGTRDDFRAPIGEQLRAARELNKLDIEEVAQELHLDIEIVTALENDERDKLPAQIFVQGYLKSYARLVGLPADALLKDYNDQAGEPPPLSVHTTQAKKFPGVRLRTTRLIRNIFFLLLAAMVLWFAWPLALQVIEAQRDTEVEQMPGRLQLPPAGGGSGNGS